MTRAAAANTLRRPVLGGFTIGKEKKMTILITNARGNREAWGPMFDGLLMGVHALSRGGALSDADRVLLVVHALKVWPDHAVTTMVDRVMTIETTTAERSALDLLPDRHVDALAADAILRPVIFASTVREMVEDEVSRLVACIRAVGVLPSTFGLPG